MIQHTESLKQIVSVRAAAPAVRLNYEILPLLYQSSNLLDLFQSSQKNTVIENTCQILFSVLNPTLSVSKIVYAIRYCYLIIFV